MPNSILYPPLASFANEIRLLRLEPRSRTETIACTLSHVDLHDPQHPPLYEALSYMWGPKNVKAIELNGQSCEIRENLWQALSYLRLQDQPRILWIDALCINQNNVLELNHQVAQMHLVYKKAKSVVVWLGLEDEASSLAISTVTDVTRSEGLKSYADFVWAIPVENWRAVETFCYRAYWTRLWIIQEILSAQEIMIYCGSSCLNWHAFYEFLDSCSWDIQQEIASPGSEWSSQKPVLEAIRHSIPFRLCQDRSGVRESQLFDLCIKYGASSCENPRDKIFGLQSMTEACCRDAVPIDYTAPVLKICCELLTHTISHESPIQGVSNVENAKEQAHLLRKVLNIPQFNIGDCEFFIRSIPSFQSIRFEGKVRDNDLETTLVVPSWPARRYHQQDNAKGHPSAFARPVIQAAGVGCTNRIKRLSVGINDWILTEDLSTNK
jgi:hypothetical protein